MTLEELNVVEGQFENVEMLASDLLKKVEFGDITRNQLERELKEIVKSTKHCFEYIKNEDWK